MAEYNREVEPGGWAEDTRITTALEPKSQEEARREIERTRGRISATLDAIEDRVDRKKDELKDKADVLRPVRRRVRLHPWPTLGAAFGTGLLLSIVRRGGGARGRWKDDGEREEQRRWRAERRARLRLHAAERMQQRSPEREGGSNSPFTEFGHAVAGAIADGLKDRANRAR